MIIRTKIKSNSTRYPWQLRKHALYSITTWPIGTAEKILDDYLKVNHHTTLKAVCLNIFSNSKTVKVGEDLVTFFSSNTYDKLANFITYGDGKLKGCKIIRDSFRWKE